jgi:hypothetical protein
MSVERAEPEEFRPWYPEHPVYQEYCNFVPPGDQINGGDVHYLLTHPGQQCIGASRSGEVHYDTPDPDLFLVGGKNAVVAMIEEADEDARLRKELAICLEMYAQAEIAAARAERIAAVVSVDEVLSRLGQTAVHVQRHYFSRGRHRMPERLSTVGAALWRRGNAAGIANSGDPGLAGV